MYPLACAVFAMQFSLNQSSVIKLCIFYVFSGLHFEVLGRHLLQVNAVLCLEREFSAYAVGFPVLLGTFVGGVAQIDIC